MNTNTINQEITSFLKLKNDKGEDVYSIDRMGDNLVVSPSKQSINMFDTLTLCNENTNNICNINLSEIFITALCDALEKNKIYGDADVLRSLIVKKGQESDVKKVHDYYKRRIVFREISECFPDYVEYIPPNSKKITDELELANKLLKGTKKAGNETCVRKTSKVGANDPCHCGSGNKYKRCCKQKDDENNVK